MATSARDVIFESLLGSDDGAAETVETPTETVETPAEETAEESTEETTEETEETEAAEGETEAETEEPEEGESTEEEAEEETEDEDDDDRIVSEDEVADIEKTRRMSAKRFKKIYPFYNKARQLRISSPEQLDELAAAYQDQVALQVHILSGKPEDAARAIGYLGSLDANGTAVRNIAKVLPAVLFQNDHDGFRLLSRPIFGKLIQGLNTRRSQLATDEEKTGMGIVINEVAEYLKQYGLLEDASTAVKDPESAKKISELEGKLTKQEYEKVQQVVKDTNKSVDEKLNTLIATALDPLEKNLAIKKDDLPKFRKQYRKLVEDEMRADRLGMARIRKLEDAFVSNPTDKKARAAYVNAYVNLGLEAVKASQTPFLTKTSRSIVEANNKRVEAKKESAKKRSVTASANSTPVKLPGKAKMALSASDVLKRKWGDLSRS